MITQPIRYITDQQALGELCLQIQRAPRLAVDTEFVGEDTFVPRLELVQVATVEMSAVIDVPATGPLDALWELLSDGRIEKVVHAGRQDLELVYAHAKQVPSPVFDTQMAAAMVGYGTQISYAQLVERVVGAKIAKSHTLTNWSYRPLTEEQLAYALDDVHYLLPVHDHLVQRLQSMGRQAWMQEEFARLTGSLTDGSREPRQRYQRIKGWEGLKPQAAAVLRELVAWRDEEARRRNVPRGRIVRDEVLLQLARHIPKTPAALRSTRGLNGSEVERNGAAMMEAIRRGLAVPPGEWPDVPKTRRPEPESIGQVEVLQAVLKARAAELNIAPTLLATAADLQAVIEMRITRQATDVPLLQGWRRELAGKLLLEVLDGKVSLSIDPKAGQVKLSRVGEA
ncbi:MAG: ribonuclease D [Nitrospirae bacterium]|nr:ribonuclease D [Nitrospirota bacterium]